MSVLEFRRRPKPKTRKLDWVTMVMAVPTVSALGALGYVVVDQYEIPINAAPLVSLVLPAPSPERRVQFEMCSGSHRHTCVVDGDTIWLDGENLRLEGYDTPEPYTAICGGQAEVALAKRASARLLELLNSNAITVETGGLDGTGKRTLATIRIDGRDVGDILIDEGLARRWPDGNEWWCQAG
ncbi:thermonuclease family protein [Devosia nitrariae]|uniref:TNase-like domain-containing protein n=1 Tax=Devosia nitrariae TaxID=2071872 RepID=A0ABQ5W0Q0_9HYPH|nr:thermonuclease family protein [Devosia nitrariae]GLQ53627.1 hypothetical protein GCM10010862_08860 [Devosia nitrariae]